MNYSGDAAEQVVRMSLNGIEVAAKISGKAAERLAVLLYAVLKDQKKTRGKTRLTNMLKSGKELKVFAVKDGDLQKFCEEAKKYGVLYCVLKDRNANDGLTDIMVRAEDASKINRIFERFNLATVDMASVKTEIQRDREAAAPTAEEMGAPERTGATRDPADEFAEGVVRPEQTGPTAEKPHNENPTRPGRRSPVSPSLHPRPEESPAGASLSVAQHGFDPLCDRSSTISALNRDRSRVPLDGNAILIERPGISRCRRRSVPERRIADGWR